MALLLLGQETLTHWKPPKVWLHLSHSSTSGQKDAKRHKRHGSSRPLTSDPAQLLPSPDREYVLMEGEEGGAREGGGAREKGSVELLVLLRPEEDKL